jgi:hypothetical protein
MIAHTITDDFIRFLVPKRSEVQDALKTLYFLSDKAIDAGLMSTELEVHGLMVGVGFSLWRAVFTAHKPLTRKENLSSSKDFLANLIATNAVAFPAEQVSWAYGYYINNARLRLKQIVELLPEENKVSLHAAIKSVGKTVLDQAPTQTYENMHVLFLEVLQLLDTHLNLDSRSSWPPKPKGYAFD